MRTLSVKKHWFSWLSDHCIALGFGSVPKLRNSVWGEDAFIVKCVGYKFRVDEPIFHYLKEISSFE